MFVAARDISAYFRHVILKLGIVASPQRFFVLAATLFTLLYASFVFPVTHYFHGTQRSLQMVHYGMGIMGYPDQIPASFLTTIKKAAANKLVQHYPKQTRGWDKQLGHKRYYAGAGNKVDWSETAFKRIARLGNIPLEIKRTVPFHTNGEPQRYPVIGFLPSILPTLLGLALGLSPVITIYLAMAFKAAFGILLGYWVIRILPVLKWAVACVLLLPSFCVMRLLPMPDTLCTELAYVLLALVLRYGQQLVSISRIQQLGIAILCMAVALIKQVYFPLAAISALIPRQCFRDNQKRWYFVGICVALSLIMSLGWVLYVRGGSIGLEGKITPGQGRIALYAAIGQVKINLYNIYNILYGVQRFDFRLQNLFFWSGYIRFSHLAVLLSYVSALWLAMLALVPFQDDSMQISRKVRVLALSIACSMLVVIGVATAAMPFVYWMQGRYVLPVLPLLLLAIYNLPLFGQKKPSFLAVFFVVSGCIIWLAMHYVMLRIQHVI